MARRVQILGLTVSRFSWWNPKMYQKLLCKHDQLWHLSAETCQGPVNSSITHLRDLMSINNSTKDLSNRSILRWDMRAQSFQVFRVSQERSKKCFITRLKDVCFQQLSIFLKPLVTSFRTSHPFCVSVEIDFFRFFHPLSWNTLTALLVNFRN